METSSPFQTQEGIDVLAPTKARNTRQDPLIKGQKRATKPKKQKPVFTSGIPSFLVDPSILSFQKTILKKLGASVFYHHPVPHEGKLLSLEDATALREKVWKEDFEGPGLICVSVDPGTVHFAMRVEKRRPNNVTETLFFDVLNLDPHATFKTGKANARGEIASHGLLSLYLMQEPVCSYLQNAHIILLERQGLDNDLAMRISTHFLGIVMGLLVRQPRFTVPLVVEVNAKLKNFSLKVPYEELVEKKPRFRNLLPDAPEFVCPGEISGIPRTFLKKFSIEAAKTILETQQDVEGRERLNTPPRRKKNEPKPVKRDDLADTVCQLRAFQDVVCWNRHL